VVPHSEGYSRPAEDASVRAHVVVIASVFAAHEGATRTGMHDGRQREPEQGRTLGPAALLRRFMVEQGLLKQPRKKPGRLTSREQRSYEAEYVGGLWHLDFHHGSLEVPTSQGKLVTPLLLGILIDAQFTPESSFHCRPATPPVFSVRRPARIEYQEGSVARGAEGPSEVENRAQCRTRMTIAPLLFTGYRVERDD